MKTLLPKSIPGLQTLFDRKFKHHQLELDCAAMQPLGSYCRGKMKKGNVSDIFAEMAGIKTPIIYWFEFNGTVNVRHQLQLLEKYRRQQKRLGKKNGRVVPLSNANGTGKVLYVGKRLGGCSKKTGFTYAADRMEMHLGYSQNCANQGLQLCHWSDARLTLNVVELSKGAAPYLTALELLFAIELSPRLGRH